MADKNIKYNTLVYDNKRHDSIEEILGYIHAGPGRDGLDEIVEYIAAPAAPKRPARRHGG